MLNIQSTLQQYSLDHSLGVFAPIMVCLATPTLLIGKQAHVVPFHHRLN